MLIVLGVLAFGCGDSEGGGGDDGGADAGLDASPDASETDDGDVTVCEPGAKRCDGAAPETCAADGSGWESAGTCEFLCTAGECSGECTPGATRCTDLVPETCDEAGAWVAGAACDFVCMDGGCVGECVPGTLRCTDTQPELCSAAGVFEASGAACEFVCTAGVCEGACVPGTTRCEGLSPQACDATGTYQPLSADCPYVCSDAACTGSCVPGTKRCAGNAVELCDATGAFVEDETCEQECSAGVCVCSADYSGDGYGCEPLDFCDPTRGGCGPNAICTQVGTTPACACNNGYEGAGLACSQPAAAPSVTQDFDDASMLGAAGWSIVNSSSGVGSTSFQQGQPTSAGGPFDSYNGAANSYVYANYNNTGNTGTISTWLVTPELDFGDAASFEFYTRKPSPDNYGDRLEVRVCSTLPCAAPGQNSVAGYETVLTSINPNLVLGVYPTTWTRFEVTNANGIPRHGRGRIAFRYYVTGAGLSGTNSDYIGIDAVRYSVGAAGKLVSGSASFTGGAANITLSLNRQVSLPISASGAFTFPRTLSPGTPYVVTVQGAPAGTTCVVTNGAGTVGANDVTDVAVSCTTE